MEKQNNILVTRELSDEQIEFAKGLDLHITIEPAIEIEYRNDWFALETVFKTIKQPILAFTSQHGVEAFKQFKDTGAPVPTDAPVYAVGDKTAEALKEQGLTAIVPEQHNGSGLARIIADDFLENKHPKDATVLHFCGDMRRDEFRQFLTDSKIKVRDMVVYKTILKSMNIPDKVFDGILFYSPSAVQAFRESGGFVNSALPELFAIGSTTAEELSIESGKHVHISPKADTDVFLKFVANNLKGKTVA